MNAYTISDFNKDFPDDHACLEYIKNRRWPDGIICPPCGQTRKHHRVTGRTAYACDYCGHHVYPLAGTIFEKSTTPLRYWFHAMYVMGSTRCGISAKQIERETGVTYKTAWRIFKQVRTLMVEDIRLEGYSVEVDETYVGGKRRGGKRGRGAPGKTIVAGAVERGGRVIARVVPDVKARTLLPFIRAKVLPRSTVYTDELPSYNKLWADGYMHRRIHHASKVYVRGDIHTNSIEGFWSLVKRGIGGVHHAVSQKYLQSYLDEYAFRYNRRGMETPMFLAIVSRSCLSGDEEPYRPAFQSPAL